MGTHYQGTADEKRALNAYIALMRAAESVTGRLNGPLEKAGLSPSQFGVLETLLHLGPLCQRALGEKLLKTSGNMTLVIDNLEKEGLVERQRNAADRRYITVHLTPKGRQLVRKVFPQHAAAVTREFEILTIAEREQLRRLCRMVGLQKR